MVQKRKYITIFVISGVIGCFFLRNPPLNDVSQS